ncbi:MAG TPA: hypothetical protein VN736_23365 [Candidatus Limnocylindrales bacterium]|nr:hypothetical protein [Candidatus Limnocylindrales bacterium]
MNTSVLVAALAGFAALQAQAQQPETPQPDFPQLLTRIAAYSPDPCLEDLDAPVNLEANILSQAAELVTQRLNTESESSNPQTLATTALKTLELQSSVTNLAWPEEARFRFEVLEVPPILVVKLGIRTQETVFVLFRQPPSRGKRSAWEYSSIYSQMDHAFRTLADVVPLHRGPSGRARFLVTVNTFGCAGSFSIAYHAREFAPKRARNLLEIIDAGGARGLDDKVPGFEQIGEPRTEGAIVELPYCWFSPIDTWDNPSLCAVDRYDLSRDDVQFVSRTYNRPDLVPVAKAIEYAEARDDRALMGYCASPGLAQQLVRDLPLHIFADEVRVTELASGRELVELGLETTYRFTVERRNGVWLLVSFSSE